MATDVRHCHRGWCAARRPTVGMSVSTRASSPAPGQLLGQSCSLPAASSWLSVARSSIRAGFELVRPGQAGVLPAVLHAHAVEDAIGVLDLAALHPVEDVVGVREPGGASRLMAIAARPPERHETRIVSSGSKRSRRPRHEVRVEPPGEALLLGVPRRLWNAKGMLTAIGGWPDEDVLLRRADIEDPDAVGVRLPQVVGLLRGHVEPEGRLRAPWRSAGLTTAIVSSCGEDAGSASLDPAVRVWGGGGGSV